MIFKTIYTKLGLVIGQSVGWLEKRFKQWTQPTRTHQLTGTLVDLTRSKSELIAENMFLRHQMIVLKRQAPRPRLTPRDWQWLVLLASRFRGWREALVIVQPKTLVGWHRQGFKLYWRCTSRGKRGRPPVDAETIALIEELATHNRTWRVRRIQGELLKLGIRINKGTVRKYMRRARQRLPPTKSGQTWATFLHNHASETWACNFVQNLSSG